MVHTCARFLFQTKRLQWFIRVKYYRIYFRLEALSEEALTQIKDKKCDSEMREEGIEDILKFGIAFSGKEVKIKAE